MGSSADTSRVEGSHPYKTLPWQKQLAVRKELYSTQSKHNLFGQRILLFKDKADFVSLKEITQGEICCLGFIGQQ